MALIPTLAAFLGGGSGAICRFWIAKWLPYSGGFPWATFCANVVSCIILGFLMAYQSQKELGHSAQILLMTGFCGGFSTFSTFTGESYFLLKDGHYILWICYILASILACLAAFHFGSLMIKS